MSLISKTEAIARLNAGELVVIPTETVYGLAARIDRRDSLRSIFTTKGRPFFDPLIVHVHSKDRARALFQNWSPAAEYLADCFWPGPLTLVLPKSQKVSDLITSGLQTVAVRWPNHPLTQEILENVGVPLAAPSANRFGKTSPTCAEHVTSEFNGTIPVVDGGACLVGIESTVVQLEEIMGKTLVKILRPGGVSQKELIRALSELKISFEVKSFESIHSPGHLKHHYQPEVPLLLTGESLDRYAAEAEAKKWLNNSSAKTAWVELPDDPRLAARELYAQLRHLSQPSHSALLFCIKSQHLTSDWEVILDRLTRAASAQLGFGQ